MAAKPSQEDFFSFVGGLNTEGGYFLTPKNTWKEGDNVVPQKDGSIERRYAVDLEDGYTSISSGIYSTSVDSYAFSSFTWQNVNGDATKNILVTQFGNLIFFYDASVKTTSTTKYSFEINLETYRAFSNDSLMGSSQISCSDCYGKLIIVSQDTDPIVVEYENDIFTVTKLSLKIRDLDGIESPVPIETEKTEAEWNALNFLGEARYNLYNQGWYDERIASYMYYAHVGGYGLRYPANTKQASLGKNTDNQFSPETLNSVDFGTSYAPRGRIILDAFAQDRRKAILDMPALFYLPSTPPGMVGINPRSFYLPGNEFFNQISLDIVSDKYRPSCCAFFAGRSWYSGVPSGNKLGWVMFSQIITTTSNLEKCYQQNDPVSEVFSDLLDTDGGIIQIPEAGVITGLSPLGKGLLVFATNGVWMISGGDVGFTPVDYVVEKVSNNGCFAKHSIVQANDFVYYWSVNGINKVGFSPQTGAVIETLTDSTIKSYYLDIPLFCKRFVEGKYNDSEKIVYWLYSENEGEKYRKNKILCFDKHIGCFYTQTIDSTVGPIICSLSVTKESINLTSSNVIDASGNLVVDDSSSQVIADVHEESAGVEQIKFITLLQTSETLPLNLTFSQYSTSRVTFNDWVSYNNTGADVAAYVLTGYNLASSGPTINKTGNYVTTFMKRTEETFDSSTVPTPPSSCIFQTRWDFTDNSYTGKWSNDTQLYRINRVFFGAPGTDYDNGYPLVITKNKLRGRGKSVQMKFSSETGKDMKLVGWSATFTSNAT